MEDGRLKMKEDIMNMIVTPLMNVIAEKEDRIHELEKRLDGLTEKDLRVARASAADRIG